MLETGSARGAGTETPVDAVEVLAEAVQRPVSPLYRAPGTPARRPFDAQYWACWAVAVVYPLLVVYLWVSR